VSEAPPFPLKETLLDDVPS